MTNPNSDLELVVDNFAGGGGASIALEAAIGRPVDIAINHDEQALCMHRANHPYTHHEVADVWDVDPRAMCAGRPVQVAWFSPDCTHHSKAKGGKPRKKEIRGLAWVVIRWAATVRPRIIFLENVEEFEQWGPLGPDGRPCPQRIGITFKSFVRQLEKYGYRVDWQNLVASDYGAPTTRKRLFLVARCDGQPIQWPAPTHGNPKAPGFKGSRLKPWRTAAECIDWSLPCPSIFERKRPLADNTLRRIARGIDRFVVNNPKPFIVSYYGRDQFRGQSIDEPLRTQTTENRFALVCPTLATIDHGSSQNGAWSAEHPITTVTSKARHALVCAFLAKHYTGVTGHGLEQPIGTVTATDHHSLVTSHLVKMRGSNTGQPVTEPLQTICAGGTHFGEVRAFLIKYYSSGGQWQGLDEPMHTITGNARLGLVMVHGEPYQIVDIGLRMLQPHELFKAQGFPNDYIIDPDFNGKPLTKTAQVKMCGNSVSPPPATALIRANLTHPATARVPMEIAR